MLSASMDLAALLAARLEADGATPHTSDASLTERDLLAALHPSSPPSAAWIADALLIVAQHQQAGAAERVWPLLRVIEPLLADLAERDPRSAGRVHGALAAQALLEIAPEAFLERASRAADVFDRVGDARRASVERTALGAAHAALGADADADRDLRAALLAAEPEGLALTTALARHHLARVLSRRGALDEARALAGGATAGFAEHGDRRLEGAARASLASVLASLGLGADAEVEARRAIDLLADAPPERALADASLARALLAQGKAGDALAAVSGAQADARAVGWLAGGSAAVWLALTDAHLATGAHEAAASALAEARRRVLAEASKLRSPALRRSYLERVPEHRRALGLDVPVDAKQATH